MKDLSEHFQYMRIALQVAEEALSHQEVPIGAIFVRHGEIIAKGFNQTNETLCGIRHAEFVAIDTIRESHPNDYQSVIGECTLYVTVEPCIMCASALAQIGIAKVVFGCGNDRFGGNGTVRSINKRNGEIAYLSYPGILDREAVMMLRRFYVNQNGSAPVPQSKKTRVLVDDDFPKIQYEKYLTLEEFVDFYGKERSLIFETGEPLAMSRETSAAIQDPSNQPNQRNKTPSHGESTEESPLAKRCKAS